ncbi:MAG: hypothetical protein ACRDMJ_04755 [Solirubrobacteraceae bacterium]
MLLGTASDAAAAIAAKEVSSCELTEAALRRIEAVNPRLNAIVELRAEEALQEAARVQRPLWANEQPLERASDPWRFVRWQRGCGRGRPVFS